MKNIRSILVLSIIIFLFVFKVYQIMAFNNENEEEPLKKITEDNVCIALNYHRVRSNNIWFKGVEALTNSKKQSKYNVYDNEFKKQMIKLKEEGAYIATLDEIIKFRKIGKYPKKCVWISFDDLDRSVYENAFPILKEMNIPFTLFVIAGQVGNNDFSNLQMATWDQLKEMKNSGLASFGSHTYDMHYLENGKAAFLDSSNYEEFKRDIIKSKEVMHKELQVSIESIAYPFGETSDEITNIVKEAGFKDAFILRSKPINTDSDSYYQNRYLIDTDTFNEIIVPWIEK